MSHADRFIKRKNINISYDKCNIQNHLVDKHLMAQADINSLNEIDEIIENVDSFKSSVDTSECTSKELLASIEGRFNQEQFDNLIEACRRNVISAIVIPFGIGRVMAGYDKKGGNVTTFHNAQNKVYAHESQKYDRSKYDKRFKGPKGSGDQFTKSQLYDGNKVVDAYTGKEEIASETSPDHIVSLSQYNKNGGFIQTDEQKADFGADSDNYALTKRKINESLRDSDKKEWSERNSTSGEGTNAERFDIDTNSFNSAIERGQQTAERHLPSTLEITKYFTKQTVKTGVEEGVRMGFQQALGVVLYEFFQGVFDEFVDIYHNGLAESIKDDTFVEDMRNRYQRVAERISSRWKDVLDAFHGGLVSGFLSNLVTVIINSFLTTSKRIVRVIREGFYSLVKAIKIICDPPDGMDSARAAHEASKIIAGGIVIVGGIGLEMEVDKLIKLSIVLEPLSDMITAVVSGALTGITTTFTVYLIDKMDLLKVNSSERHKIIMNKLEANLEDLFAQGDSHIKNMIV
jgi:hypothetical protein